MRLYTYEQDGTARVGGQKNGSLVDPSGRFGSMLELIQGGEAAMAAARQAVAAAERTVPLAAARLLAPIPRPGKILCSGLNYRSHIEEELGAQFLEDSRFFAKMPSVVS
jgi:2-keto-4-pentenoate hydratase/2-oxohepta-3-ene-1,7-dioic acid hydratase in catechol pathway